MDKETVQIVGIMGYQNGGALRIRCKDGVLEVPFLIGPAPFDIEDTKRLIGEELSRLRIIRQLQEYLAEWFNKDLEVEVP